MLSLEKKLDAVCLDDMDETVEWLVDGRWAGGGDFRFLGSGNWFIRGLVIPRGRLGADVGVWGRSNAILACCCTLGVSFGGVSGWCSCGNEAICFGGGVGRNADSNGSAAASSSVNAGPGPLDK
jgi:hypothetical protein